MHGQPEEGLAQIHGELSTYSPLCYTVLCHVWSALLCHIPPIDGHGMSGDE
jgi:hypothetical protein